MPTPTLPERVPSAPVNSHLPDDFDPLQRPATDSCYSDTQPRHFYEASLMDKDNQTAESVESDLDEMPSKLTTHRSSLHKKSSKHDILVIETQPLKVNRFEHCAALYVRVFA